MLPPRCLRITRPIAPLGYFIPCVLKGTPPSPVDLQESFAEFHESSELNEGVLLTRRRLVLKANEVSTEQLKSYKAFRKVLSERHDTYVVIHVDKTPAAPPAATPTQGIERLTELLQEGIDQLRLSSNPEALQAERDALNSAQSMDYTSAIVDLKRAVSLDPTFSRAWIMLGLVYAGITDMNSAVKSLQKAVEADPKEILPKKMLALLYMSIGRHDDAIATWQKLQSVAPADRDLWSNLSGLYILKKRYAEAIVLLESAAKANPSDPYVQLSLGRARLHSHNAELGLEALHKALEIDSTAEMLNNVAHEMTEADTNLADALGYSQKSLNDIKADLQKIDPTNIRREDLQLTVAIGAYWDTMGWIYFKMGNLPLAESYLKSAWELSQDGVVGDHLGQLYEKKQMRPEAFHMYNLALEANPGMTDTQARMRMLAHVPLPEHRMRAGEELSWMRTVKLPKIIDESATADFNVLVVPSGKIEKAFFVQGSELLRKAINKLPEAPFTQKFPSGSTAYLPRRGTLFCGLAGCSFVFYRPSVAVDTFVQSTPGDVH